MSRPRTGGWYRFLLRLLPFDFRAEFGSEMEDAFRQERSEVRARRSIAESVRFVMRTLADIARTAPHQRWSAIDQDVRLGLRMMRRRPGFAAAAILTLALPIAAATTVFAVAKAVVFRPLPYPEADRLVFLTNASLNLDGRSFGGPLSYPEFLDARAELKAVDAVGLFMSGAPTLAASGGEKLNTIVTSASLFSLFAGRVVVGRPLSASDERPGAPPVAVLSYHAWVGRFGRDAAVVGRRLTRELSGEQDTVTVVGVAAPDVVFPAPLWERDWDAWLPLDAGWVEGEGYLAENRSAFVFRTFARLAPGAELKTAQEEVALFSRRHKAQYLPPGGSAIDLKVAGLKSELVGNAATALRILLAAVGVLLLIACVNVATLLLARASPRHHEFAVRAALGAGRLRLARQLLTESAVLCAFGGVAGISIAYWAVNLFVAASPTLPRLSDSSIDWTVLGFAAGAVVVATLVTGVAPALQSSRRSVVDGLKRAAGYGGRGPGWSRSLWFLLTVQLALALILLTAGGLMLNSFVRLLRFDLGFDPSSVLLVDYWREVPSPSTSDWKRVEQAETSTGVVVLGQSERRSAALREDIQNSLVGLPGVTSVALTTNPPLGGMKSRTSVEIEGRTQPPGSPYMADIRSVSAGYFQTMAVRLRRGRLFRPEDREGAARVAVVNETAERVLWGGKDANGRRIRVYGRWAVVVGVVADVRHMGPRADPDAEVYISDGQTPRQFGTVLVRVDSRLAGMDGRVVQKMRSIDAAIHIGRVRRLDDLRFGLLAPTRFATLLLSAFALVAFVLVLVGIHGVTACLVEQRRHEIGVRMVLGATSGQVKREVVRRAFAFAVTGTAAGLLGALAAGSWIRSLLFGVTPTDAVTLIGVAIVLLAGVIGAAYGPARRAALVDPLVCLRAE